MPIPAFPASIQLAQRRTPVMQLDRSSQLLGVELWMKRDDLTGCELSGNKVRKLEFLVADAEAEGADTLITGGGEQSNHCRAVAMTAARRGLGCQLLLRTVDPGAPPDTTGNILLDRLAGAAIRWIDHDQWANRDAEMAAVADEVRRTGGKPYVIPEGGSNAVGAWGYVSCAVELAEQLAELPTKPTTIVYACGSGGTGAGLILARSLGVLPSDVGIVGVNVCDDRDYFVNAIMTICTDFDARYGLDAGVTPSDIDILDGFVGRGYAKSRPEELRAQVELCRREGVVVDPVYTGKAYYAIEQTLAANPTAFGERVVFIHTGGIFGLLGKADAYGEVV